MGAMAKPRIEIDPDVHHGKPVIEGTRVPVHLLVGSMAGGMTLEDVADEYGVETEDVKAALEYASHLVSGEDVQPLEA